MIQKILTILALGALSCVFAHADTLILEGGGEVSGHVTGPDGGKYRVETRVGTVWVDAGKVKERKEGESLVETYLEKRKAVSEDDAAGLWTLAEWCGDNDLERFVKEIAQAVVKLEPDHADARKSLGFVKHKGKWITQEMYYGEIGYVLYKGKWMSQDEMKAQVALDETKKIEKKIAAEKRAHERELKRMAKEQKREEQLRRKRAEYTRRYLERQRYQSRRTYDSVPTYGGYYGGNGEIPWWWLGDGTNGTIDIGNLPYTPFGGGSPLIGTNGPTVGTGTPSGVNPGIGTIPGR
jgi:hypothetical protein